MKSTATIRREQTRWAYQKLQEYLRDCGQTQCVFTVHDLREHFGLSIDSTRVFGGLLKRGRAKYHSNGLPGVRWRKIERTDAGITRYVLERAPVGRNRGKKANTS